MNIDKLQECVLTHIDDVIDGFIQSPLSDEHIERMKNYIDILVGINALNSVEQNEQVYNMTLDLLNQGFNKDALNDLFIKKEG